MRALTCSAWLADPRVTIQEISRLSANDALLRYEFIIIERGTMLLIHLTSGGYVAKAIRGLDYITNPDDMNLVVNALVKLKVAGDYDRLTYQLRQAPHGIAFTGRLAAAS